ncbi:chemotaxis-specific protein-glutamate methyltransferase CheB [Clostridium aciditolerans]|uniref:Protein-glutamate methylesterase/protein-glutamine glutaminase n=1 Tax=Clostridium aciditolerans TaxID=339861 RepID=A0A934HWL5_9CLOT|nr:chemotaxis-specific protein-glutamate methyltransferase CheB [Clostridium aciditolerans]MBI6871922.1 chemotaxis-specific protein-glutamate methyltransferase CheB [Clostridium aciditolerans]
MIKVLVVDDSPTIREIMKDILTSDKDIEVIGVASNGEDAVRFMEKNKPDIITMDIDMPKMNGFEATRKIMETTPVPIVIITALFNSKDMDRTFQAMEAGAVSVIEKPTAITGDDFDKAAQNIVHMIKLMSEIKVIKRKTIYKNKKAGPLENYKAKSTLSSIKMAAIGVSTGGPPVLQSIFSKLPANIKIPILVVQHITPGFIEGLVDWLSGVTEYPIHIAVQGEKVLPGHIYFAPDGFHMEIRGDGKIFLSDSEKENGLRPAVSCLFRSIARYYGKNSIGILLTGMGKDGAEELKLLKDIGAITVAQDKETSIVYGMPGEAVKLDAATYILPPEKIAELFGRL